MNTSTEFQTRTGHREAEEAKIRRRVDMIIEALRAKDLDALRRVYTDDVVSFDVEPPLQHVGIEAKLANLSLIHI